jgi:hypothetical protein
LHRAKLPLLDPIIVNACELDNPFSKGYLPSGQAQGLPQQTLAERACYPWKNLYQTTQISG